MNGTKSPRKLGTPSPAVSPRKQPVLLIMSFEFARLQTFKNRTNSNKSILTNAGYGGECIGVSHKICKEWPDSSQGYWTDNKSMAVFRFPSYDQALRWYQSDTEIKQPDYLGGSVDVIICQLEKDILPGYPFISLMDIHEHGQYNDKLEACEKETKGCTIARCIPDKKRGMWDPEFLVVQQWKSEADFKEWLSSEKCKDLQASCRADLMSISCEVLSPRK